jgi:hypothetical protein
MQISGKVTAQELADIGSLVRPKWYWPKLLIQNLYGLLIVGVLLWTTSAAAMAGEREHWRARIVIWLVIAGLFGWVLVSARRSRRKELVKLNAGLPDRIHLVPTGIQSHNVNGAMSFPPWSALRGWRSTSKVILLDLTESEAFIILPIAQLASSDVALLRGMVSSQLGTAQSK